MLEIIAVSNLVEISLQPEPALQISPQPDAVLQIDSSPVGPPGADGTSAGQTPVATTSGTSAALTVTFGLTEMPGASAAQLVVLTFHTAPDAGATLDPDGLGALPLHTPADTAIGTGAVTPGITLPALIRSDRVQLILL